MSDVIEVLSSDDEDSAAKKAPTNKPGTANNAVTTTTTANNARQFVGVKRTNAEEQATTKKRLKTNHVSPQVTHPALQRQNLGAPKPFSSETVMVFDPKSRNVVYQASPKQQMKITRVMSLGGEGTPKDPLATTPPKVALPQLSEVAIIPLNPKNAANPQNKASSSNNSRSLLKSAQENGFTAVNESANRNVIVSPVPGSSRTSSMSSPGTASNTSTPNPVDVPKKDKPPPIQVKKEMNSAFTELLEVCKSVEKSKEMDLITTKLTKYYHGVHPDFVNSASFIKSVEKTAADIKTQPAQVFFLLKTIVDELKIRQGGVKMAENGEVVTENDEAVSTGDPKLDKKLYKLNRCLYITQKKIEKLRQQDAMWEEENNSSYLMISRFEKRAVQIYEKICELTGESTDAKRMVKRPVKFKKTKYTEFNRSLQSFVNKTKNFPDFYDVLKVLEYCNTQYDYGLNKDNLKIVAQNAFQDLGETLQGRRKLEEYESLTYFANMATDDPALHDAELARKLEENKKYHSRIDDVINKYAEGRHIEAEEMIHGKRKRLNSGNSCDSGNDDNPPELVNGTNPPTSTTTTTTKEETTENEHNNNSTNNLPKTSVASIADQTNDIKMEPELLSLDDVALFDSSPTPNSS
ncbi:daxx-like protein [Culicoides brevitarsis]|uniref:daxx-like protein n=1 Tax=Culicoides brevitarsis TaxID=469753 RepID=UPI00307C6741